MTEKRPYEKIVLALFDRVEKVGMAREKLSEVLNLDIWDDLSKHNSYWDSEHEKEADKLDETRMKLSWLHEKLLEIHFKLMIDMENE